jgi:4-diphosphocytidyl-2-C-methyl-D-erythritol kinase
VTLFESVSLADEVSMSVEGPADRVVCPGVDGPNIVADALAGLRARGWQAPAVTVAIGKRIPVAAGMGGGSADAAAVLRLGSALAPVAAGAVGELAASLGADVPSQLSPGLVLGTGAGDVVEVVEPLGPHAFVVIPQQFGLSTADVYREADRLGLPREVDDLAGRMREVRGAVGAGGALPAGLLVNDLEPAALSLRPELEPALDAVRAAGASHAMVSGSGPTVLGLYWGQAAATGAAVASEALAERYPGACSVVPVTAGYGDPAAA